MKPLTKLLAAAALSMGLSATLASCHDDEVNNDANGGTEQLVNNEQTADALHYILYNTTALDTLPANWTSSSFCVDPTCGEVLDQTSAGVRTILASSTSEAVSFFKLITNQDGDTYSPSWSHDSIGTITLNTDSTASLYGTIDFNVRQLNLEQIRFVPESALSGNYTIKKWTPRYHFGDVLEVTKKNGAADQTPEYWLCVRGEFSDPNVSGNKEVAHWVCFTLDDATNIDHREGDITIDAPKNLDGQNEYLQYLPRLLQIICDPREAWDCWRTYVSFTEGKSTRFFESPFPKNYLLEPDFIRISNNIKTKFNELGGIQKLIPAFGGEDGQSLINYITDEHPIAFICNGVSYPTGWKKFNPVTFKNVHKYSGRFFSDYTKYNVKYEFPNALTPFDIRKVLKDPYYQINESYPNLWQSLTASSTNYAKVLVVRSKSADKFDGIQNPKNHGEDYVSTKLNFKHIVADTLYESETLGHNSGTLQVPVESAYMPGDLAKSLTYTNDKPLVCIGSIADGAKGNEVFATDTKLADETYAYVPDKEGATRLLFNLLNARMQCYRINIETLLSNWDKTYDWQIYANAISKMRKNSNTLNPKKYNDEWSLVDALFTDLSAVFRVKMFYKEGNEDMLMQLEYDQDKNCYIVYTRAVTDEDEAKSYYLYHFNNKITSTFTRTAATGVTLRSRDALEEMTGKAYDVAKSHITAGVLK